MLGVHRAVSRSILEGFLGDMMPGLSLTGHVGVAQVKEQGFHLEELSSHIWFRENTATAL